MNRKGIAFFVIVIILINITWINVYKNKDEDKIITKDLILKYDSLNSKLELAKKKLYEKNNELECVKSRMKIKKSKIRSLQKLARSFRIKDPSLLDYKEIDLRSINGKIFTQPYADSNVISEEDNYGFIHELVINDYGETWFFIESLTSYDKDKRFGFVQGDAIGPSIVSYESDTIIDADILGIHIGENIYSLIKKYGNSIVIDILKEHLIVQKDEVFMTVNKDTWLIESVLTKGNYPVVLDYFSVGDNAKNVLEFMKARYTMYYKADQYQKKPLNWFNIGESGLVLGIEYDTQELEDTSEISEIRLIKVE